MTTGSSVVVVTVSGTPITSVQFAVQVAQAEGTGTGAGVVTTPAGAGGSKGAAPIKTGAPLAAVAGVVFGLAVGL